MAIQMINVEKSKFIEKNIDIYNSNKLGQYSKFLDKNQIFVTYYPVNEAMSTVDLGTGNIDKLFGDHSPMRYNKITYLPAYNIPELKPDFEVSEEEGARTSLELSDITFLPNTIQPKPYDLMIISLSGAQEILFQVSGYRYNTIQSNDYYSADFTMYTMGRNLEEKYLSKLIVESYQTVFENIGTQDKCFIRTDDVDKINTLVRMIQTLKQDYREKFYDELTNSFILKKNSFDYKCKVYKDNPIVVEGVVSPPVETIEITHVDFEESLYDPFLEKFITETGILESDDASYSLALTQNDLVQPDFNSMYSRSLWSALENHTDKLLEQYMYFYQMKVTKLTSPFTMFHVPAHSIFLTTMDHDKFMDEKTLQKRRVERASKDARLVYENINLTKYSDAAQSRLNKIYKKTLLDIMRAKEYATMELAVKNSIDEYRKVMTLEDEMIREYIIKTQDYATALRSDYPDLTEDILSIISETETNYIAMFYSAPLETLEAIYESYVDEIDTVRESLEEKKEDETDGTTESSDHLL